MWVLSGRDSKRRLAVALRLQAVVGRKLGLAVTGTQDQGGEETPTRFHSAAHEQQRYCLAGVRSNILCGYITSVSWHDLRGGCASANACSDRDEVRRKFDGNSKPDRFRTVPQLWGLPLGVQHSEYHGNLLGHLQEVSNRCKC